MTISLVVHTGYSQFKVGLFNKGILLKSASGNKQRASQQLALAIKNILNEASLAPSMVDFFAADCGPGPFTSLRTAITTANGLGFALKKPLVSLNSLEILLKQEKSSDWPVAMALYNAYNNDFYYAIQNHSASVIIGCASKSKLIELIGNVSTQEPICFMGDGIHLLKEELVMKFANQAYFPEAMPLEPSLESFGKKAYELFLDQKTTTQLQPIYLKTGYNLPSGSK